MSNYNCSISFRSGKNNADADRLSRKQAQETTIVFPEVLKATSSAITADSAPFAETLVHPDETNDIDEDEVPKDHLEGTSLSDWQKAQASDSNINFIVDHLLIGQKPTSTQVERGGVDQRYVLEWEKLQLKDGVLYRTTDINGESVDQLVLPASMKAYHDNLGRHQGRDRTTSLIRHRFF